jgi:hypothetical protein
MRAGSWLGLLAASTVVLGKMKYLVCIDRPVYADISGVFKESPLTNFFAPRALPWLVLTLAVTLM